MGACQQHHGAGGLSRVAGADRVAPQNRREEEDSVDAGQGGNSVVAGRGDASLTRVVGGNHQWIGVLTFIVVP